MEEIYNGKHGSKCIIERNVDDENFVINAILPVDGRRAIHIRIDSHDPHNAEWYLSTMD